MGLTFLVPAFLAGLAALAIPVVLHLLNRERKESVRFPSLMFVRRVPYRSIRRQSIRHPWLLLLRCIALALLAAAFSRPFLERSDASAASARSARDVAVLLDRSYSMGYGDRWERARAAARTVVAGLAPGSRSTCDRESSDMPTSAQRLGWIAPHSFSRSPGSRSKRSASSHNGGCTRITSS